MFYLVIKRTVSWTKYNLCYFAISVQNDSVDYRYQPNVYKCKEGNRKKMNANCEINYLCIALAMLSLLSHLSVKTGTTFVTFPLGLYPEDREMHSVVHCCANLVRAHHMFSRILNLRIYEFYSHFKKFLWLRNRIFKLRSKQKKKVCFSHQSF